MIASKIALHTKKYIIPHESFIIHAPKKCKTDPSFHGLIQTTWIITYFHINEGLRGDALLYLWSGYNLYK